MIKIFPSLISADLLQLKKVIVSLEDYCDGFHLDVMDFHFVPNLTFGPAFVNAIRKATSKQLQIHLMVDYPERYLETMELNENDIICVHTESISNLTIPELFEHIRSYKLIPSLVLNPFTPLEAITNVRTYLEHVLVMSVQPGFSGQKFMPHTFERIKALQLFKAAHNLDFTIAVDGGINSDNIKELVELGAQELAIASAIFSTNDPVSTLQSIQKIVSS